MLKSDINETIGCLIDSKIGIEWKHEVQIYGMSSVHINFSVDGHEYVMILHEVKNGHHYSEYIDGGKNHDNV